MANFYRAVILSIALLFITVCVADDEGEDDIPQENEAVLEPEADEPILESLDEPVDEPSTDTELTADEPLAEPVPVEEPVTEPIIEPRAELEPEAVEDSPVESFTEATEETEDPKAETTDLQMNSETDNPEQFIKDEIIEASGTQKLTTIKPEIDRIPDAEPTTESASHNTNSASLIGLNGYTILFIILALRWTLGETTF